jgi:teichuronic acid biosynthesis glycosyltransferase TuaC
MCSLSDKALATKRIVFLSSVFPSPWARTKGTFNFEMLKSLARSQKVMAIAPISWIDARRRLPSPDAGARLRVETQSGMTIRYPTFYYCPKILRSSYHRFLAWSLRSLKPTISEFRPDAVLGYWAHPDGAVAMNIANEHDAAGWIMVGGSDVLLLTQDPRRRRVILSALGRAKGVICVSEHLRERVIAEGVDASKVHVVRRGVDRTRFQVGSRVEARVRLGLSNDRPLLLWVGRMVAVKGLELLIEAAHRLKASGLDFEIYLAGNGPEREKVEAQSNKLDLKSHVRFVGSVPHEELAEWYRAADVTLLSSRSEGIPNVLLESHACGTPFVATDVGGVREIAISGVDRLLRPGNAAEFADMIVERLKAGTSDPLQIANCVSSVDESASRVLELMFNG